MEFQIVQKIPENYCPCLYLSTTQVWWLNELGFKRYIQKYTVSWINTHYDVTDLVNHRIIKNTKTWIPKEREKKYFLRNNKILNQCLRWHILRSYPFVVEVTFKEQVWLNISRGKIISPRCKTLRSAVLALLFLQSEVDASKYIISEIYVHISLYPLFG